MYIYYYRYIFNRLVGNKKPTIIFIWPYKLLDVMFVYYLGGKKLTGPTVSAHLSSLTLSLLDQPKSTPLLFYSV